MILTLLDTTTREFIIQKEKNEIEENKVRNVI